MEIRKQEDVGVEEGDVVLSPVQRLNRGGGKSVGRCNIQCLCDIAASTLIKTESVHGFSC